jgi:hypothetical protein
MFRPRDLTYDGLWAARVGVWTGLLLVSNLVLVWWAALSTWRQVEIAEKTYRDDWVARRQNLKPVVFTEYGDKDSAYLIRNVGGGFALNVYVLVTSSNGSCVFIPAGSLGSGQERELSDVESKHIGNDLDHAHVILAEGRGHEQRSGIPH